MGRTEGARQAQMKSFSGSQEGWVLRMRSFLPAS